VVEVSIIASVSAISRYVRTPGRSTPERAGSGRKQQSIVGGGGAVSRYDFAPHAIDPRDRFTQMQSDAVRRVPLPIVQHDLREGLFTREDRREQDAVVVRMRFGTEHGDVVELGSKRE
jgi:hypothetical protein